MTTLFIIATPLLVLGGFLAIYFYGMRIGSQKQKQAVSEAENEILLKQRDNRITTVDDADKLWDKIGK